jgi:hypothetical protein
MHTCPACHGAFTPKRTDARYCSNKCRQKAYRTKQRGGATPIVRAVSIKRAQQNDEMARLYPHLHARLKQRSSAER